MRRVSLSQAARWKRKQALYRDMRGNLVPVARVERKRPNFRLTLEDGRSFLVDPRTTLIAD